MLSLENLGRRCSEYLKAFKWAIIVVLVFILSGVGVKVYLSKHLKQAVALQEQANLFRVQAEDATKSAEAFKLQSTQLQASLDRANTKLGKLQAALDKVAVPPAPTALPSVTDAIADLKAMGLELVCKPSVAVKPSVAGITADGIQTTWFWGKQALRVPALEEKVSRQEDLVKGLHKAKDLSETLVGVKTQEASAWQEAALRRNQEALALQTALTDTQKALKAERKLKIYYTIAGAALTAYVVRK